LQGLCAYILAKVFGAKDRGVVIGYDHRHNSERWAQLAALVSISYGLKTYLLQGLVHTPMVPFSVKRLEAACGIMITGECRRPSIIHNFIHFYPSKPQSQGLPYSLNDIYGTHLK
jgi:phosphomannomutase